MGSGEDTALKGGRPARQSTRSNLFVRTSAKRTDQGWTLTARALNIIQHRARIASCKQSPPDIRSLLGWGF